MSDDLNEWLHDKLAAAKKLHPELAANAAKVRAAQDPNKPGAEKPDLYAKGKGKGKDGRPAGKQRMIPTRKELEGPARTPVEKIAETTLDTLDKEYIDWLKDVGDLGLKTAGGTTPVSPESTARGVAIGAGIGVPVAIAGTIAAQKALSSLKEAKEKREEKKEQEKKAAFADNIKAGIKNVGKAGMMATNPVAAAGQMAMSRATDVVKKMLPGKNKQASFVPNPDNEDLLRKLVGSVQSKTRDVAA